MQVQLGNNFTYINEDLALRYDNGRWDLHSIHGRDGFIYRLAFVAIVQRYQNTVLSTFCVIHALDPADGITLSCVNAPLLTVRGHGHITYSTFPIRRTFVT